MRKRMFAGAMATAMVLGTVSAALAQDGWVPYTEDQLGGGTVLEDARAGKLARGEEASAVDALLAERGVAVVTQSGWEAIDGAERAAGEPLGRPRVKLAGWDELLDAAGGERVSG